MRKLGWALIGVTAFTAFGLQTAVAGETCKIVPSWCPADRDTGHGEQARATSVPEPATLMLLGAGVSAVGAAALRRRKNKKDDK